MAALWLILAAAAAAAAAAYTVSLRRRPWWPCRSCRGTGKTRDRIWKRARGTCPACGGKGQRPRLGVRIFQPSRARELTSPKGAHKRIDRRNP